MNQDTLRIIDGICREKGIERDEFIADLENAIASAVRKAYGEPEDVIVNMDPIAGQITAHVEGAEVDPAELGRIAAQTAKQVIIQKTRERERTSIQEEYTDRVFTIVTGTVVRVDRGNLIVNLGRVEGFLPRSEQIPGESHLVGERIRVMVIEVREQGNQVKIILSRSHPDFIQRLFEVEVPEVSERVIEIKALAREAGYRSKVAVSSIDAKVDAVGACVGMRGSRIKNIVDELGGEKIDIVRWNESSQILIQNALKPAEVEEIALSFELNKATVVVAEDQLSLAIGKRGQNVRLAARLTGWDIDISTPTRYNESLALLEQTVKKVEGTSDMLVDQLVAMGIVSVSDLDEVDIDPLVKVLEVPEAVAQNLVEEAGEEAIRLQEEKEAADKRKKEAIAKAKASGIDPASLQFDKQGNVVERAPEPPPATAESTTTESTTTESATTDPATTDPATTAPASGEVDSADGSTGFVASETPAATTERESSQSDSPEAQTDSPEPTAPEAAAAAAISGEAEVSDGSAQAEAAPEPVSAAESDVPTAPPASAPPAADQMTQADTGGASAPIASESPASPSADSAPSRDSDEEKIG